MTPKQELMALEYRVCHEGYMSRDGLVPEEFSQMLRSFLILLGFSTAVKLLFSTHMEFGAFLYWLIAVIGLSCLIAYSVNIEAKSSCKRALRKRMSDIEGKFRKLKSEHCPGYWQAVVGRDKGWIESICKRIGSDRTEKGSASGFFVFASWILVLTWIFLECVMYFGDIQLSLTR